MPGVQAAAADGGNPRSGVAAADADRLHLNLAREEKGGRRGLLREGGLRSLQEEEEEEEDTPAPVETPSPDDGESEDGSDTPAPQGI